MDEFFQWQRVQKTNHDCGVIKCHSHSFVFLNYLSAYYQLRIVKKFFLFELTSFQHTVENLKNQPCGVAKCHSHSLQADIQVSPALKVVTIPTSQTLRRRICSFLFIIWICLLCTGHICFGIDIMCTLRLRIKLLRIHREHLYDYVIGGQAS